PLGALGPDEGRARAIRQEDPLGPDRSPCPRPLRRRLSQTRSQAICSRGPQTRATVGQRRGRVAAVREAEVGTSDTSKSLLAGGQGEMDVVVPAAQP